MFEYYGWISIPMDDWPQDEHEAKLNELQNRVAALASPVRLAELKIINAHCVICVAGVPNRLSSIAQGAMDLFHFTAERHPMAYGVLCFRDWEKDEGLKILRIQTGLCTEVEDSLFDEPGNMYVRE